MYGLTPFPRVGLTHHNEDVKKAAAALTQMMLAIAGGSELHEAISEHAVSWGGKPIFEALAPKQDRVIIGQMLTPACYMPESFAASLALAWKYHGDFKPAILIMASNRAGSRLKPELQTPKCLGITPRWIGLTIH